MRLTVYIGREIPEKKLAQVVYAWGLVARSLGFPALLTDRTECARPDDRQVFRIHYGTGPDCRGACDLFVPYEELRSPVKVKVISGTPVLYSDREPVVLSESPGMGFDPVGAIAHMLSGVEELASGKTDELGRHVAGGGALFQRPLYGKPLVNMYLDLIDRAVRARLPGSGLGSTHRPFALALSHDVDWLDRFSVGGASNNFLCAVKARKVKDKAKLAIHSLLSLAGLPLKYVVRPADAGFFETFCRLEEKRGFRSTFLLLPPKKKPVNYLDAPYSYSDKVFFKGRWRATRDVLREVLQGGWEIGLHAGVDSYCDAEVLKRQKRSVEEVTRTEIRSVRQHRLCFRLGETWEAQEKAGIVNDSTYGFNLGIGFRGFFCHPYRPFSLRAGRPLKVREVPLVIQDKALFNGEVFPETRLLRSLRMLGEVKRWGGVATLLWHSDSVRNRKYPGLLGIYEALLDWAASEADFVGSIADVADWWEKKQPPVEVSCVVRALGGAEN